MKIRGISCERTRRIVERAIYRGWRYDGKTRSSHGILTWPPTGEQVFFSLTPGDGSAWKHVARDIERVSGVVVWQRTKHGAGHRRPSSTPESARMQRERERFAAEADARAARRDQAKAADANDRDRRSIEDLMRRPG